MKHPTSWLQVYHDNQLNPKRRKLVAEHLEVCSLCRQELTELNSLSMLLQESQPASEQVSADVFVAQVGMRLPRKAQHSRMQTGLETGWRLAPFGILTAWTFVQAVFIVATFIFVGLRWFPGAEQVLAFLPASQSSLGMITSMNSLSLLEVGQFGRQLFGSGGPLGWGFTLNLGLTLLIGLLYLSWLATWWIRNSNGNDVETYVHAV